MILTTKSNEKNMEQFFQYIKKPIYSEEFEKISWGFFFGLILIYILSAIPTGMVSYIITQSSGITHIPLNVPFYQKVFFGIILAPIGEEIIMRLVLVFNRRNLLVFIITCFILTVTFVIKQKNMFVFFSSLTVISGVAYFYFDQCKVFFINHFRIMFFGSAILFGLFHIFNFNGITISNFYVTPFLVLPQLFMGFILGFIRVKYGYIYGVLFHALINTTILMAK